jgi:hypothetical protein
VTSSVSRISANPSTWNGSPADQAKLSTNGRPDPPPFTSVVTQLVTHVDLGGVAWTRITPTLPEAISGILADLESV